MSVRTRVASRLTRAGMALARGGDPAGPVSTAKAYGGGNEPPAMAQAARDVSQMGPEHPFSPGEPVGPYDGYSRYPRVSDYRTGANIATRPRTNERVSFDTLRGLIEAYDVAQIVIWHKIDILRGLRWKLLAADGHKGDVTGAIAAGMAVMRKPDGIHNFRTWFGKWFYDVLAYDAAPLYRMRNRAGNVTGLLPFDGTTLAPLQDYWGNPPAAPAEAYVQYVNGVPWNWLTRADVIYEPFRAVNSSLYGRAPIESIILNANTDIRFQVYFLQRFTEGNIPAAFASAPDTWSPDQIEQFQAYWDGYMYGDQSRKSQVQWIPGGSTFAWSNEKDFTDAFSLFLMRKTCASFHTVPTDLGFTETSNYSSGESQSDVQHKVGELPPMEYAEEIISQFLYDDMGLPVKFEFDRGEDQDDRLVQAQADDIYIKNGTVSGSLIRELRFGEPEPSGQIMPRYIFTERSGPVPLAALMGVAGQIDPESGAPLPGTELPHEAFTEVQGVLSNPPVISAPLAEEEYGPKAIPPAPPPQPVGIPEATDPARQVAKEGNGAAAGIAADTGIYSYDLVKPGDEDDGEDKAAVAKAELAAFRRFRQARRKAGAWRDFEFRAVDPETARELNDAGRAAVRKAASGYTVSPRSGMISLDVPDGLISPLPGGGTDFHVTVAYLGADVGDDLLVQALTAARDAAATVPGPLDGTLSGISSFPPGDGSDGKVPAFIPVQLPGAEPLRAALEYLSASDHPGWTPHVTVAYLEPGDALPGPLPPTPVTFTHLSVHRGGEVTRFPLGPGTPPASDCCGAECCADGCCNGAAGCQCAPAEVAKAGGNPKDWAGWRLADKAAAYWAPLILAAVSGALTPAALSRIAAAYLDAFPDQQGDAPGKRDRNDAAYGWLTAWLAAAGITLDLAAQAAGILTDGYLIGSVSAAAMIDGTGADLGAWKPGDSGAASDRIAALGGEDALAALLGQSGAAATAGMTAAFLGAISRALAGSDGDADAATLAAALAAVAADRDLATGAALDELYASAGTAALDYYPGHYDGDFQWVVDPTLSNCAICLDNAAADPRPLGEPWPSGDTGVNIHKGCGCALCPS